MKIKGRYVLLIAIVIGLLGYLGNMVHANWDIIYPVVKEYWELYKEYFVECSLVASFVSIISVGLLSAFLNESDDIPTPLGIFLIIINIPSIIFWVIIVYLGVSIGLGYIWEKYNIGTKINKLWNATVVKAFHWIDKNLTIELWKSEE